MHWLIHPPESTATQLNIFFTFWLLIIHVKSGVLGDFLLRHFICYVRLLQRRRLRLSRMMKDIKVTCAKHNSTDTPKKTHVRRREIKVRVRFRCQIIPCSHLIVPASPACKGVRGWAFSGALNTGRIVTILNYRLHCLALNTPLHFMNSSDRCTPTLPLPQN